MDIRIDPFGPDALLVRHTPQGHEAAFARGLALQRHLEQHPPVGLAEITPGFTTLLLEFTPGTRPDPRWLSVVLGAAFRGIKSTVAPERTLEIPVIYDGPDLPAVAAKARLSVREVIALHAAGNYRVALLGFAPGFPYLSGLDRRLHTPRLETPRTSVPTGSVAIGGEHTGIYPAATAGGWNLIGRTPLNIVDTTLARSADPKAFLFQPGDAVRFVAIPQEAST
ncbi:MAG: 5-oxoprolinase subunit PxpB [Verrucomicrobiales bacterium]|nr:5-oxoprolinase subunit PxpB [Verrucomicrobiales bacterium]